MVIIIFIISAFIKLFKVASITFKIIMIKIVEQRVLVRCVWPILVVVVQLRRWKFACAKVSACG